MKKEVLKAVQKIVQKYKLSLVILFGSYGREQHAESDLDIAIYPTTKINEEKLYEDLVSAFRRTDIDIINIKEVYNHLLLFEILHKGTILYEKYPGLKSTLEWQSFIDYVDFQRFFGERSHLLDKKIAALTEQ